MVLCLKTRKSRTLPGISKMKNLLIVTGGAGGIGIATVKMLLDSGAIIGVIDKDKNKLGQMKKSINKYQQDRTFFYKIDIGNFKQVQKTVNEFYRIHKT